jgi:hypothetical protein
MENSYEPAPPTTTAQNVGLNAGISKNTIIIILLVIIIISFLGINVLSSTGNLLKNVFLLFQSFFGQIFAIFGYTAGTVIDTSADVIVDTTKTGIDIAGGTAHSIGDLLKKSSAENVNANYKANVDNLLRDEEHAAQPSLKHAVNAPTQTGIKMPSEDTSESPIQNPITSSKQNWCLVGEYQGRRGCISIDESDQCLSGQVFPSQSACLNPTQTNNVAPFLRAISENDVPPVRQY